MLVIRQNQIEALSQQKWDDTIERFVAFVNDEFPGDYAALGHATVTDIVERSVEIAKTHGLLSERDCLIYIYLVFSFGEDFELHPDHSWALSILTGSADDKADRLWDEALKKIERKDV